MKDYIVYTEIHTGGDMERWYYGTYDRNRANEVALSLGNDNGVWHCVCKTEEAKALNVLNLPSVKC